MKKCKKTLIFTDEEKMTISLFNDFNTKGYLLKYPVPVYYSRYGYAFDFFIIGELIKKLDYEHPPTFFESKDYLAPKACFIVEK